MKVQIKSWAHASVLFEADIPADTREHFRVKRAVEAAVKVGANLDGARLDGARLDGARLGGASLGGANLYGARLDGARLDDGSKLKGERPILQIGPIGSRCAYFVTYITDKGLRFRTGCFFGDRAEFEASLEEMHNGNAHVEEYRAALAMVEAHAKIWTPK